MPLQTDMIRREIGTQTRVIDAKRGTVEYIASSQAVDSCGDVVCAAGADFSRFERNAPFVDSHNYGSIDCLLGKVIDFRVVGKTVVETCQWAIDVPTNTLALKGFQMTQAGYLKAVSIGFIPQKTCRPNSAEWQSVCEDLGMGDLEDSIACVYQKWLQLELSACCIGANPEAVAKSRAAGIIEDSDLLRFPAWRRALQSSQPASRRAYSFPSATQTETESMSAKSFVDNFTALCKPTPAPTVTQAAENLEFARRGQSETDCFRASALMRYAMARERRLTVHEMADQILSDGLIRDFLDLLPRYLGGADVGRFIPGRNYDLVRKSLVPGSGLGQTLLPIDVSKAIFDLVLINGAFRNMGVVEMTSQQTKIAQVTSYPSAIWITPANQGLTTIPTDAALAGTSTTPEANTIAILVQISRELLADEKANLSYWMLTYYAQAIAAAYDYVATQGNGNNDQTNGSQTGIWNDTTISTVSSDQGNTTIAQLARGDFLKAVAAVAPAALQRECKWVISPSFIAPLMTLVDSQGKEYLLKTPACTGDGTWRLVGFEVVWAAQAPAVNQPGSIIAAFGHLPSYQVGIRTELEVMMADGATGFGSNSQFFRALGRGFCQTRAASGLAKLALANG